MSDSKPDMKLKVNTKQRILSIIVIVLLLVGGVSFFTYRQFSDVAKTVAETAKSDPAISKTRKVLFNISQAENQIRRYTLTKDTVHLESFDAIENVVNELLESLTLIQPAETGSIKIDTFTRLVKVRFEILKEIVLIQDEFRVEEAFNQISIPAERKAATTIEKPQRIRNWFKRKNKQEETHSQNDDILAEVNENIRSVREDATSKEEALIESELKLLSADGRNAMALYSIVEEIELIEENSNKKKIQNVSELVKRTNLQVIIFSLVISALLIFMSITIFNYIRRNSVFRQMLSKAKNEAESLADAKALFIATVSHEIRTPINIISGFSEQLNETELDTEQQDQLKGIMLSSSHLLDLVNSVLDFTKLENGSILLENKNFAPERLVKTVTSILNPLAEENEVKLITLVDDSMPNALMGDPFRIRQILINLIGNAIKFSKGGQVEITMKADIFEDSYVDLNFSVADNGIGMSPEQLEKIFDEFAQAKKSTSRLYGGTGLGMPITKKLIELQKGTIQIDSKEGIGTTVSIVIPLKKGKIVKSESNQAVNINLENVKILIVDDEPFNRKLLKTILTKYSATIFEAGNGQEAIDATDADNFDIILMDIQMPIIDGFEATKRILKKNPEAKIIALTASGSAANTEKYTSAGMVSYLGKPFRKKDLLDKLSEFISAPALNTQPEEPQTQSENHEIMDEIAFEELKQMSNGDTSFYVDMLETFEQSTSDGVQKIQESILASNWKTAGEVAHRICAPCKHLAANTLYDYLKEIEENCLNETNLDTMPAVMRKLVEESDRVCTIIQKERISASNP